MLRILAITLNVGALQPFLLLVQRHAVGAHLPQRPQRAHARRSHHQDDRTGRQGSAVVQCSGGTAAGVPHKGEPQSSITIVSLGFGAGAVSGATIGGGDWDDDGTAG